MLKDEEVKQYFKEHPEAVELLKNAEYKPALPKSFKLSNHKYRAVTADDVQFITIDKDTGRACAWIYPDGVPTPCDIGNINAAPAEEFTYHHGR